MTTVPHVFLDTSVLKFAVDRRLVLVPEKTDLTYTDGKPVYVHKPDYEFPNRALLDQGNKTHFRETLLLSPIADLATRGAIKLLCHNEVEWEFFGLPKTNDPRGRFYGAPIERVPGPVLYGRILVDGSGIDHQFEFLKSFKQKRFLELQKATGAYQGEHKPPNRNQILDAWHLWCAEHSQSDYFLTLDKKLQRAVGSTKRYKPQVHVIAPEALVRRIVTKRPRLLWPFLKELVRVVARHRAGQKEAETEYFGAPLNK